MLILLEQNISRYLSQVKNMYFNMNYILNMRGFRKFCQGFNFDNVFFFIFFFIYVFIYLFDEWREHPNISIIQIL